MIHGINNQFLYSAKKINVEWAKGNQRVISQGTGFFIVKDSTVILITNRHVVEPGYSEPQYKGYEMAGVTVESYASFDDTGLPQKMNKAIISNWSEFEFHKNSDNDVACLRDVKTSNGISDVNSLIPYEMLATSDWISEKLSVCDTIAYPGFPKWYDHQNNTPIFRMGTIASDPRLDYSYDLRKAAASIIAYEGFSSSGASGSPVFAVQRGFPTGGIIQASENFYREVKLVGINAGHFKDVMEYVSDDKGNKESRVTHSGISYFYKSSVIHDIIDN